MRVWLVALFLVAFNLSLSVLGAGGANFWYATGVNNTSMPGERYDFNTHTWYMPNYPNGSYYDPDTKMLTEVKDASSSTKSIGADLLSGLASAIFGEAGGKATQGLIQFWGVITGIFTSTGALLTKMHFPEYLASAVQTIVNLVIIYGGLQFFLGRSGKTVE
jgi:hypothetical protein